MPFTMEAILATSFLLFKSYLAVLVSRPISGSWSLDKMSSLVAGWSVVYALQACIILFLSAFTVLNGPTFLASMLIAGVTAKLLSNRHAPPTRIGLSWLHNPASWAVIFALLLMWLRAIFFYDYTWDAQTYGLPRLVLWLNSSSVFVNMPAPQLNLFVNEWNGEFNALAYALASGTYLGFSFGNLEILLWIFVSIAWLAQLLGASASRSVVICAALGTAPAFIGLASTVKGDLLAILGFIMSIGWLLQFKRSQHSATFGLCLVAATLSIGAKVSVAIPATVISMLAILELRTRDPLKPLSMHWLTGFVLTACLAIFSSRFWTNWAIYGNPLERVAGEEAHFSINYLLTNLDLVANRLFNVWDEAKGNGTMWALSGSMGSAAWFIVLTLLIAPLAVLSEGKNSGKKERLVEKPKKNREIALIVGAVIIATLIPMAFAPTFAWSFRYFAPGLIVVLIATGTYALHHTPKRWQQQTIMILACLTVLINLSIAARPGEVLPEPIPTIATAIKNTDTPLKRIALRINGPMHMASVDALGLDSDSKLNILAFQEIDTPITPFLGSFAQNKIQLVPNKRELIRKAATRDWDIVAIIQRTRENDHRIISKLEELGYFIAVHNSPYMIAIPSSRVAMTPIATIVSDLQWTPFNAQAGVTMKIVENMPLVTSDHPVDSGFFSKELTWPRLTFVRASFEGTVSGQGPHAAHLSLHGIQPIITLPPGHYSSLQNFSGMLREQDDSQPQRLSFGLGGWGEGSGSLQLKSLEFFEVTVKDDRPDTAPN